MKKLICIVLSILSIAYIFSQNYVSNIESTKKSKNSQLIRVSDDSYELLSVGEAVYEDDTLQTGYYTKAQIMFDGLTIDIDRMSQIVVKYAYLKEKQFKANYELKKGKIHVSFDSSKYDDKELKIYIPYNKSTLTVTGTEFDVNSKGYIKVLKGTVRVEKPSRTAGNPSKAKVFVPGDFGSIDSEVVNNSRPPEIESKKPMPPKDHDRPAPPHRDNGPRGPGPAQAPGMNKAPTPSNDRK